MIDPSKIDHNWERRMFSRLIRNGDRRNAMRLYAYTLHRDAWLAQQRMKKDAARTATLV